MISREDSGDPNAAAAVEREEQALDDNEEGVSAEEQESSRESWERWG